jgi:hypothetical protein
MLPKTERTMLFERGHAAQDPLVQKMGETPFHRLLDLWAGAMYHSAQVR